MNKKEICKNILKVRSELSVEERARCNDIIREYVLTRPVYMGAHAILAYASYQSEVDTTALIKQALADGKNVFAPKVSGDEMEFWQITSGKDLQEGYRGIPEPVERVSFPAWLDIQLQDKRAQECMYGDGNSVNRKRDEDADDGKMTFRIMMWMPGVAFDNERHRIGYGKGFYDRYLYRLTDLEKKICCECHARLHLTTAALAYRCQVLTQIPYESHDVRPDMLITEEGVLQ